MNLSQSFSSSSFEEKLALIRKIRRAREAPILRKTRKSSEFSRPSLQKEKKPKSFSKMSKEERKSYLINLLEETEE